MPEAPGHHATRWLTTATIDPERTGITAGELVEHLSRGLWDETERVVQAGARLVAQLPHD